MTMCNSIRKFTVAIGLLQLSLIANGCAHVSGKWRDGFNHLWHCEDSVPSSAFVNVGGLVHEPQRLELENGTTLRRALMSAGGARELALTEARTTTNPGIAAELSQIISRGRELGRLTFQEEAWDNFEQQSKIVFAPRTQDEIVKARQFAKDNIEKQMSELVKSLRPLSDKPLTRLKDQSVTVGKIEEEIRLFGKIPSSSTKAVLEDNLRRATKNEQTELKVLTDLQENGASLKTIHSENVVVLSRAGTTSPVTYYFPYDLVISGQPGEILLQNKDSVDVVDIRDTQLQSPATELSGDAVAVAVDGYVEAPGEFSGIQTIGSVHSSATPTINDPRSVWMLVRPGATGTGDRIFVLPDRMVRANGPVADAPTVNGDVYLYVILPQVPIVFDSLLTRTLDAGGRGCLDKIHEKKAELKETHALRHDYRAMLRAQTRERGQAQAQAKFAAQPSGAAGSVVNRLRARLP